MSESIFLPNMHHAYYRTDGTYAWPNSFEGDQLKQAKKEIEANIERIAELEAALREAASRLDKAADDIADWGTYASDYFRDKHNLDGDIEKYTAYAQKAREVANG